MGKQELREAGLSGRYMECMDVQIKYMWAPASGRGKLKQPHHGGEGKIEAVPLVPPYIESLRPYEAGRTIESVREKYGLSRVAKLGSNENPLGASPKAIEAMSRVLNGLNLYPNGGLDLREVLAREYDVKVENVIAGSGSRRHHEQHHPRVSVR